MNRIDDRTPDALRPIHVLPNIAPNATGSALISFGNTRVICAACVTRGVPRWMIEQKVRGGWMTAEYSMLPYSTGGRKPRDISRGRLDGRSSEIQRLIGRSMRAVVDLKLLDGKTCWIDCDVLQADGGTRTASITGACLAAAFAFEKLIGEGELVRNPMRKQVAAVSAGIVDGDALLDLCYVEDRDASVDFNVVMTEDGEFVEIQGSGEEATYSQEQSAKLLELCGKGVKDLIAVQRKAIEENRAPAGSPDLISLADHFGPAKL